MSNPKFSNKIYVKTGINVFRDQIWSAASLEFYTHSVIKRTGAGQTVYQYMIETKVSRKEREELRDQIKSSCNINITWMG